MNTECSNYNEMQVSPPPKMWTNAFCQNKHDTYITAKNLLATQTTFQWLRWYILKKGGLDVNMDAPVACCCCLKHRKPKTAQTLNYTPTMTTRLFQDTTIAHYAGGNKGNNTRVTRQATTFFFFFCGCGCHMVLDESTGHESSTVLISPPLFVPRQTKRVLYCFSTSTDLVVS